MVRDFSNWKEPYRSEYPGTWVEVRKKVVKKCHFDRVQKQ